MRKRTHPLYVFLAVLGVVIALLYVALLRTANAQVGPVVTPPNPNSAVVVAYASAGLTFMTAVLAMFREDNPIVSGVFSPRGAAIFVAIGGVLEASALTVVHGTPWVIAVITGATSAVAAYVGAARRVKPGSTPGEASSQKSGRPAPMPPP